MLSGFFLIGASLVFQSPSLNVPIGTNVTLSCDITQVFGQCSSVRWLLYRPGDGLKLIYGSITRGIMTITNKALKDTHCLLNIPQASRSDNGTFYCLLLNSGLDYMGNGTQLTVVGKTALDATNNASKVNNEEHRMMLEQVLEHQCLFPVVVSGGFSLLLGILAVIVTCICQKRVIGNHRTNITSEERQQSSRETLYATLRFGPRKQENTRRS